MLKSLQHIAFIMLILLGVKHAYTQETPTIDTTQFLQDLDTNQTENSVVDSNRVDTTQADTNQLTSNPNESHSDSISPDVEQGFYFKIYKSEIETNSASLWKNTLIIENPTAAPLSGNLEVYIPDGFKLIGPQQREVELEAGEQKAVLIMVLPKKNLSGNISYALSAEWTPQGQVPLETQCYLSVPKSSKWSFNVINRADYWRVDEFEKTIPIEMSNQGNAVEVFKIEVESQNGLLLEGSGTNSTQFIELKPGRDTTIYETVFRSVHSSLNDADLQLVVVRVNVSGEKESIIVRFANYKSEADINPIFNLSPLNISIYAQNLLGSAVPRVGVNVFGEVHLDNNDVLDYNMNFFNVTAPNPGLSYSEQLWRQSRLYARYSANLFTLEAGDVSLGQDQIGFGRGGKVTARLLNTGFFAGGGYNEIVSYDAINYNAFVGRKGKRSGLVLDAIRNEDRFNLTNKQNVSLTGNFSIKKHSFYAQASLSEREHLYAPGSFATTPDSLLFLPDTTLSGYGGKLTYGSRFERVNFSWRTAFGSQYHTGVFGGRLESDFRMNVLSQDKRNQTLFNYFAFGLDPLYVFQGARARQGNYLNQRINIHHTFRSSKNLSITTGPTVDFTQGNRIRSLTNDSIFLQSIGPKWFLRLNGKMGNTFMSPYMWIGYLDITDAEGDITPIDSIRLFEQNYYTSQIGFNVRNDNWSLNLQYNYGLTNPFRMFTSYGNVLDGKYLTARVYYQKYLLPEKVRFSSNSAYNFNTVNESQNLNLNANFDLQMENGWSVFVFNNLNFYSRNTEEAGDFRQTQYMLSVRITKQFGFQQPKLKYYPFRIITFKDLNGNGTYENNEPLLPNILVQLRRSDADGAKIKRTGFYNTSLITNEIGEAQFDQIPEDSYTLNIENLYDSQNLICLNGTEQEVMIRSEQEHYIPFVQAYKIVGRVEVDQAKYSRNQNTDLANIKVFATDEDGNLFSSLTDNNGHFTIFIPQISKRYTVKIQNVFEGDLELEKDSYQVEFNGLQVFEVVFKYKEKERKINFNR